MKTELEVARDAVRSAGLEELADNLEWAAAAVKHRDTLLSAARWAATDSEAPCPDCGDYNLHARECPTANALHALDPEWSRQQVEAAHADAPQWAPRRLWPMHALGGNRIPPRPPFGPGPINATEVTLGSALRPVGADLPPLPPAFRDGNVVLLNTDRGPRGEPRTRVSMLDGSAWELQPAGPSPDGGLTREMQWVAVPAQPQPAEVRGVIGVPRSPQEDREAWVAGLIRVPIIGQLIATSPQPAQPQPEDGVTPPASPPPAR